MRYSSKILSEVFFLRLNPGSEAVLSGEIKSLEQSFAALSQSSGLKQLMNPTLSALQRKNSIEKIFNIFSFAPATKELFVILAQDRKIKMIPSFLRDLKKIREKRFNVMEITLTSVTEISNDQQKELDQIFAHFFGEKNPLWKKQIDPEILGGFRFQSGSTLFDASFQKKIKTIETIISQDAIL